MITDLFTIIRKEWNEMLLMRGSKRSGILYIFIMVAVFGIVMPLQSREQWFTVPLLPLVWSWMPVFMTTWMVSDAIAGERERHTLETLLASRLSDSAILFGKITAAVLYGFVLALVNLLVGAFTVNIANPNSSIHFYPLDFFGALLLFVLLGCLFI
ncbi:MAG: ABC transporter permease, partial [Anaerolineaceae bacterium]|nr:ABC transporter permease [Anaerolineaceae bacterium]